MNAQHGATRPRRDHSGKGPEPGDHSGDASTSGVQRFHGRGRRAHSVVLTAKAGQSFDFRRSAAIVRGLIPENVGGDTPPSGREARGTIGTITINPGTTERS